MAERKRATQARKKAKRAAARARPGRVRNPCVLQDAEPARRPEEEAAAGAERSGPAPGGRLRIYAPVASSTVNQFRTVVLYGRAGPWWPKTAVPPAAGVRG